MISPLVDQPTPLLQQLQLDQHLPCPLADLQSSLVLPGDLVTSEQGYMHGSGTVLRHGSIYSTVVGTIQKTNKLLTVQPIKQRYQGNVGDVVVGVVKAIRSKRWIIEIESQGECFLGLNSIHMEEQRIKTEQDEFNMSSLFKESDVICAEVHSLNNDHSINLHTRSFKYGKQEQGLMVKVDWRLIKRVKKHFIQVKGVNLILGHNGHIWLSHSQDQDIEQALPRLSMVANIISLLNREDITIAAENIEMVYDYAVQLGIKSKDLTVRHNQVQVLTPLLSKIQNKIPAQINKLIKQGEYLGLN